jgi:hypothetical protein
MNMHKNKIIKFGLLGFILLVAITILGLFIWSGTGTYHAGPIAQASLESTQNVMVTLDKFITFEPADQAEVGLIFYPGGLVEPTAYTPVLRMIAEEGVLVVITPMPLNLAILNPNDAAGVITDYPYISRWIITGHSLGGASASIFVDNHPEKIDAIAFWDSYPPDSSDLSDIGIPALSIYGTTDGFPNTKNFDDKRYLLPTEAIFIPIEGANHAQFGDYGPQKGDVVATINMKEQHEIVAEIMLDLIFKED